MRKNVNCKVRKKIKLSNNEIEEKLRLCGYSGVRRDCPICLSVSLVLSEEDDLAYCYNCRWSDCFLGGIELLQRSGVEVKEAEIDSVNNKPFFIKDNWKEIVLDFRRLICFAAKNNGNKKQLRDLLAVFLTLKKEIKSMDNNEPTGGSKDTSK